MEWFLDNMALPAIGAVATAFIGWAAAAFQSWSGIQIEAKHREALHSAIMSGIGYARSSMTPGGTAQAGPAIIEQAAEYVKTSVPDALAHFGLKEGTMLHDMIAAQLAKLTDRLVGKD